MAAVEKDTFFPFSFRSSTKIRVINIAVNKDVAIPISRVVAKPLMGPVPNTNNISAVRPVVMLASKMEDRALLNPSATALRIPFPLRNSSRTRSKINTLASTEIPIVSTIPAIPGKVKTAPKPARTPNISNMLKVNAISAKIPEIP